MKIKLNKYSLIKKLLNKIYIKITKLMIKDNKKLFYKIKK